MPLPFLISMISAKENGLMITFLCLEIVLYLCLVQRFRGTGLVWLLKIQLFVLLFVLLRVIGAFGETLIWVFLWGEVRGMIKVIDWGFDVLVFLVHLKMFQLLELLLIGMMMIEKVLVQSIVVVV